MSKSKQCRQSVFLIAQLTKLYIYKEIMSILSAASFDHEMCTDHFSLLLYREPMNPPQGHRILHLVFHEMQTMLYLPRLLMK